MRSHFIDSGFVIDGKRGTINPLKELIENTNGKDLNIVQNSPFHINVQKSGRQKVKYATQLFSHNKLLTTLTETKSR